VTSIAPPRQPADAPTPGRTPDQRRAVRGWYLYDFANSAFVTMVITALGGPFLTALATDAAGSDGRLDLLGAHPSAASLYAYATSLSVLLQVLALPLLGALGDTARGKRALLASGTALGVVATLALAASPTGAWVLGAGALVVANVAFGAALVAYNGYLREVAGPGETDRVSSRGFAAGYLGGGLALALALAAFTLAPSLGWAKETVVRAAIAGSGLWWGAFGAVALTRLAPRALLPAPPTGAGSVPPGVRRRAAAGLGALRSALTELRRLPLTARYLLAFLLFNDAIQAVIALSSVFLTQELYVARGLPAVDATGFLLGLVLLIQFVAIAGALAFARVAARVGAKATVLITLLGWVGVIAYAYAALESIAQAWAMGVVIALVLGGSQALARSLFSQMIPEGRHSSFFGFYELAERGTAWMGTLLFAVVLDLTGSYRYALLSLLVLLLAGGGLLAATDTDRAILDAARAGDLGRAGDVEKPAAAWLRPRGRDRCYRAAIAISRVVMGALTRTSREGVGNIPASGPVIVVGNHTSIADAFILAPTVALAGRIPRMMGTGGLFDSALLGPFARYAGAIPVYRRSASPAAALLPAAAALADGQCLALYPEGGITAREDLWPMAAKTGVVRLALDTGAPVVPLSCWGVSDLLGRPGTRYRLVFAAWRRPRVSVVVGPPMNLRVLLNVPSAAEATAEQIRAGADLVADALCAGLERATGAVRPAGAGRAIS
jgi:UMF1 family MFS transporter